MHARMGTRSYADRCQQETLCLGHPRIIAQLKPWMLHRLLVGVTNLKFEFPQTELFKGLRIFAGGMTVAGLILVLMILVRIFH